MSSKAVRQVSVINLLRVFVVDVTKVASVSPVSKDCSFGQAPCKFVGNDKVAAIGCLRHEIFILVVPYEACSNQFRNSEVKHDVKGHPRTSLLDAHRGIRGVRAWIRN